MALSGSILLFKPELRRLAEPATRGPPPSLQPSDLAFAVERAQAALHGQLRSVNFASPGNASHKANLLDGGVALFDGEGRIHERWVEGGRFFDWMLDLHHKLLMGEVGATVTGWIGVVALLMMISGVVLWWPTRRMFAYRLWPDRPGRGGWLAAHRNLAILSAPLAAISVMTGAPQALQQIVRPVMNAEAPKGPKASTHGDTAIGPALAAGQARFPDAVLRSLVLPSANGKPVTVRLRQPGEWHANGMTFVWVEPTTAEVIKVVDAQGANRGSRLFSALWPIHSAKVGGVVWKGLLLVGGLSLAALSLYGAEAYRQRLLPSPRRKPERPPRPRGPPA
jgi:uncharacterized iron-regulated membrane protein